MNYLEAFEHLRNNLPSPREWDGICGVLRSRYLLPSNLIQIVWEDWPARGNLPVSAPIVGPHEFQNGMPVRRWVAPNLERRVLLLDYTIETLKRMQGEDIELGDFFKGEVDARRKFALHANLRNQVVAGLDNNGHLSNGIATSANDIEAARDAFLETSGGGLLVMTFSVGMYETLLAFSVEDSKAIFERHNECVQRNLRGC